MPTGSQGMSATGRCRGNSREQTQPAKRRKARCRGTSARGNVGRPGGRILALRGHSSIPGSTDIPTLYNMLPTYLPQPNAFKPHTTLKDYLDHERTPTEWWRNFPKYAVSLLKAYYGDAARAGNEFGFGWLPRIVGDHSQLPMALATRDGVIRGIFMLGQNPAVGGHNAALVQRGLAELDWLVVRDMTETETASFWYAGRPVRDGEIRPRDIGTEVFLLPASLSAEKAGSVTNTHRLLRSQRPLHRPSTSFPKIPHLSVG